MTNPKPTDNPFRVFRGGSWGNTNPAVVRAVFRYGHAPSIRPDNVGFRTTLTGRTPR